MMAACSGSARSPGWGGTFTYYDKGNGDVAITRLLCEKSFRRLYEGGVTNSSDSELFFIFIVHWWTLAPECLWKYSEGCWQYRLLCVSERCDTLLINVSQKSRAKSWWVKQTKKCLPSSRCRLLKSAYTFQGLMTETVSQWNQGTLHHTHDLHTPPARRPASMKSSEFN